MKRNNRLVEAFANPASVANWNEADWGLAIRQARVANLVSSLGSHVNTHLSGLEVPEGARQHFLAADNFVKQREAAVIWECRQIVGVLGRKGIRPTFLKGAAYALAGIPLAGRRRFSDIDVMVGKADISEAEKQLMLAGWLPTNTDPYDQRYYRQWMHEVPPLRHVRRGTVLDLHHAITPPTSRYQARMDFLESSRRPLDGMHDAYTLGPADMILHAAAHLFAEGETQNALRNLIDISELLDHFQGDPDFDVSLAKRSYEVGLSRPLYYAVRYLIRVLNQAHRARLARCLEASAPNRFALVVLDGIYDRVFQGGHPSATSFGLSLAESVLFLRGHWLRMPAHLLAPHLGRKFLHKTCWSKPET